MSSDSETAGHLELVGGDLSFPTSLTFDSGGDAYVAEVGLPFGGAPASGNVWRLEPGGERQLFPERLAPPVNGLTFHDGGLYVLEVEPPGRISCLELNGYQTVVMDNLLGPGNHHTNMVAFGPDGKLYFSQGALTNSGIIDLDAYDLGWLQRLPHAHDVPGYEFIPAEVNVEMSNLPSEVP